MGYEIFSKLCTENHVNANIVSKATGIATPTFTSWKQGKYEPKREKLEKIAEYFGVSVEYLTTGKEPEKSYNYDISDFEYEIILAYRKADYVGKAIILRTLGLEKEGSKSLSNAG